MQWPAHSSGELCLRRTVSLANDSEDENAELYDEQAEQIMTAGGTPQNQDLLRWLPDRLPAAVYDLVQTEARRVEWPFVETATEPADSDALPPAVEAIPGCHQRWV